MVRAKLIFLVLLAAMIAVGPAFHNHSLIPAGGPDLTLYEADEAASRIREEVDQDANIILGATYDPEMTGTIRVAVVATGTDATMVQALEPMKASSSPVGLPEASRTISPPGGEGVSFV